MGIFHSRIKQTEDPEDFRYKRFSPWPPVQPVEKQSTPTPDTSALATLVTIGTAFVLLNVLLAIALQPDRPKLENDHMCGITTGGKEECYFDCVSTYNRRDPSVRLIKNLDCLDDCFEGVNGTECIQKLLEDIKLKGVCNLASNDGIDPGSNVYNISDCTQYSPNPLVPDISNGTCSPETEDLLKTDECRQLILQQPAIILNTATELINSACTKDVSKQYVQVRVEYDTTTCGCDPENFKNVTSPPEIPKKVDLPPFPWKRKMEQRFPNLRQDGTLPISLNVNNENVKLTTMFDFTRTRNRYSWICSLRSTDLNAEHFCAVTLLSVPPNPTVIVGPAHCTFLCKNGKWRIPSCCCRTDTTKCSDDVATCGKHPEVVEMKGSDSQVLCGEWEIGTTPMELTGERYNIALDVVEIIRHPDFDTKEGPIAGSDIAVFKVNDEKIKNGGVQKYKLNPVCFSQTESKQEPQMENETEDNLAPFGIQAGWSEPPPFHFLNEYAPVYSPMYRDFFKQWHYRMDLFDKCVDPQNSTFGPLKCPSNTPYPAGTICAKDFAKQACFSPGESGSPLMVEIKDKDEKRFYAKGILSFVKGRGCDIYSNNPSAYTKLSCFLPWIAKQYGMDFEPQEVSDPQCTVGTPQTISDNSECLVPESRLAEKEERKEKCQNTPSNLQEYLVGEKDCIFPFYYNGQKYNECILFTEAGFVYPAFRCPVHNITTKRNGINNFNIGINKSATEAQTKDCPSFGCQIFQTPTYCAIDGTNPLSDLDPNLDCPENEKRAPFSVCKNNCPGVGSLGIIGGGALLFAASGLVGQAFIAPAIGGIGIAGVGGVGLMMMANQNCQFPSCTAQSGQCCSFQFRINGLVCPSRC